MTQDLIIKMQFAYLLMLRNILLSNIPSQTTTTNNNNNNKQQMTGQTS